MSSFQAINQSESIDQIKPIDLNRTVDYTLKIVFFGFSEDRIDLENLENLLIKWHMPIAFWPYVNVNSLYFKLNYTLNYEFEFIYDTRVTDYIDFVNSISVGTNVKYIPTEQVEPYLIENGIVDEFQPTLTIMDLYTIDPESHKSHYYSLSSEDTDNIGDTKIADGGVISNSLWLDLSAGPTNYVTGTEGEVNSETVPPIWEYSTQTALETGLANYIQTSIELKFLASGPFKPMINMDQIHLKLKEFSTVDDGRLGFITEEFLEEISKTFIAYNPFVNITISYEKFSEEAFDDIKSAMDSSYSSTSNSYDYYNGFSTDLHGNYDEHFELTDNDPTTTIPIYVFNIGDVRMGVNGIASNNHRGDFNYIIYKPFKQFNFVSFEDELYIKANTKMLVHEISHAFGMSHPFDGYTWKHTSDFRSRYFKNWLWDYTDTMMSYVGLRLNVVHLDITIQRQHLLAYLYEDLQLKFNLKLRVTNPNPLSELGNLMIQFQSKFNNSLDTFVYGYMDQYNNSLSEAYEAVQLYEQIRNFDGPNNISTTSDDQNSDGQSRLSNEIIIIVLGVITISFEKRTLRKVGRKK